MWEAGAIQCARFTETLTTESPLRYTALGGNSIGFLDRLTDRLKMGDSLKMSDFGLGMS